MKETIAFLERHAHRSMFILRIGIGLVFIYFGFSSLISPSDWVGLVPTWTSVFGEASKLVQIHGLVELVGGVLLVLGREVRIASLILLISLGHTLFIVSGPTFVRDLGLTFALISIFLDSFYSPTPAASVLQN